MVHQQYRNVRMMMIVMTMIMMIVMIVMIMMVVMMMMIKDHNENEVGICYTSSIAVSAERRSIVKEG